MRHHPLLVLIALIAAPAAADQVYRYRDANGVVHYSDTAPPVDARDTERKRLGDRATDPNLPYALQMAKRNFPVTLFVADGCGTGCTQANAYLAKRGVPHTERSASDEAGRNALLAATSGKAEVPVLIVGKSVLRGFEESAWANALDAAGYPRSSALPAGANTKQQDKPSADAKAAAKPAANTPANDPRKRADAN